MCSCCNSSANKGCSGSSGGLVIIERGPRGPRGYNGATGAVGPQGPQGARGPQGLPGGLPSYGGAYSTSTTAQPLTTTAVIVPLGTSMPLKNVSLANSGLTVTNGGDYEINFWFAGSVDAAGTVTATVAQNGNVIAASIVSKSFADDGVGTLGNTFLAPLAAGDIITVQLQSSVALNFTPTQNVNTVLTVKQLNG